jgi:flavin-dependent dehydrogenase
MGRRVRLLLEASLGGPGIVTELPAIAVGGGLAGAAFAAELARHGRGVVVLERSPSPQHKVCGEFLSADAQALLANLGVDVKALGATSVSRLRLVAGQRQATLPLPFLAAGLSRLRLDAALLAAAERAGATIVRGVNVRGIEACQGGVVVRTQGAHWRASAVALATGKHPLRGMRRPSGHMVGFKLHLHAAAATRELADLVQLVFFPGGYMGACLVEEGTLCIGWVMRDTLVRNLGSHWSAQSEHLSRQSRFIDALLRGARPLNVKPLATASLPYGFLRRSAIAPEIFPVGDQLAVVPSFTGDGMAIALASGVAAARAVLAGRPAAAYHRELIPPLQFQFRVARALGGLLQTPFSAPMIVAVAAVLPSLAKKMTAATRLRGLPVGG